MKAVVALVVLATFALVNITQVNGTCYANSCWTSTDCARDADDFSCRCVALHCGLVEGNCGGGCITDAQCADWANGDKSCVCGSLFECESKTDRERPGYETYTKFMAAMQGDKLRQKVEALYKESLAKDQKRKA